MDNLLREYSLVGAAGLLGIGLAFLLLNAGRLFRPDRRPDDQMSTYESGADPASESFSQPQHIRYYLLALLFLVFDIEIAFIVPWALQVEAFGVFGLAEIFVFIGILALGLAYAWRKGAFAWHS